MPSSESALTQTNRTLIFGYLFVLLGALGFSAKAVLVKLAYQYSLQLDAITLMVLRMAISLPFFLAVSLWSANISTDARYQQRLTGQDKLMLIGLGLLGYYLASLLDFEGLRYISAGLERLIIFLYPTLVVLLSAVFQNKSITRTQLLALSISYSGMMVVFLDNTAVYSSKHWLLGSILVFLSAVAFAFFLIGSGMMVKRIGSTRFTAYSMTVASLATCLHFALGHGVNALYDLPQQIYLLALIMALFSTVLPAFFLNAGISQIGAGSAAMLSSIGPVSTLLLAYWLLGEVLSIAQLMGTLLVLIGVAVVSRIKE